MEQRGFLQMRRWASFYHHVHYTLRTRQLPPYTPRLAGQWQRGVGGAAIKGFNGLSIRCVHYCMGAFTVAHFGLDIL